MPDTEDYLNKACSEIPDRRTREQVRSELEDHLQERASEHEREGLDPEAARQKAMEEMGDCAKLATELGQIHSFFPRKQFNRALTLLFWGLLLLFFNLDVWHLKEITTAIGGLLVLIAVFLLRKSNKLLHAGFWLFLLQYFGTILSQILSVLPFSDWNETGEGIGTALGVLIFAVNLILMTAFLFVLGFGLAAWSEGKRARQVKTCGPVYLVIELLFAVALLAPDLAPLFIALIVIGFLIILHHIWCIRTDIWRNRREVSLQPFTRPTCVALCCVLLLNLLPLGTAYLLTNRPATVKAYVAADVGTDEETLARMEELKERIAQDWGLDLTDTSNSEEQTLFLHAMRDIRQSELLRLGEGTKFSTYVLSFQNGYNVLSFLSEREDGTARFFCYFEDISPNRRTFAKQLTCSLQSSIGPWYALEDLSLVLLADRDDATLQILPDREKPFTAGSPCYGVEYKWERDMTSPRGYLVMDIPATSEDLFLQLILTFFDQTHFYRSPYNYDNLELCGFIPAGSVSDVWYYTQHIAFLP